MPNASFGLNISVSELLLVMSNITIFHVNLIFNIIVLWIDLSNNFIITKPDISSKMVHLSLLAFALLVFNIVSPLRNMGIDIFKKLKQHSHKFITPSNSNTFLFLRLYLHFHVFQMLKCIFKICDHVYLLLLG